MTPNYPAYKVPDATGITWAQGAFPLQPFLGQNLCTLADAQIVHKAMGGTLVNAADYPDLGYQFKGLDPANLNQPWMIIGIGVDGFVGPDVVAMYAKGVGHPGSWQKNANDAGWTFVFPPDPVVAPPPASSGDPAPLPPGTNIFGTVTPPAATSGGTGGGLTQAQADQLSHIEKMLVTLLTAERLSTT